MFDATAPLLIFGGPYSNLQATEALRAEADRRAIPSCNIICTGDVVAYAADPEPTAELIRTWGVAVVAGNCEEQLGDDAEDCGCGFEEGSACDLLARGWYPYARQRVSPASSRWMATLPPRLDITYAGLQICVLHGGVHQNNRFLFASETSKLEEEFAAAAAVHPCDVVVAGHAGIPFIAPLSRGIWVNAGVIGMPANDGTSDVWYALLDSSSGMPCMTFHRLSYDYVTAAAQMRRAGHANGYARTLVTGIWPSHDVLPPAELAATGIALPEIQYHLHAEVNDDPGVERTQFLHRDHAPAPTA